MFYTKSSKYVFVKDSLQTWYLDFVYAFQNSIHSIFCKNYFSLKAQGVFNVWIFFF